MEAISGAPASFSFNQVKQGCTNMTMTTIRNMSRGPRSFKDISGREQIIPPGQSRAIDLPESVRTIVRREIETKKHATISMEGVFYTGPLSAAEVEAEEQRQNEQARARAAVEKRRADRAAMLERQKADQANRAQREKDIAAQKAKLVAQQPGTSPVGADGNPISYENVAQQINEANKGTADADTDTASSPVPSTDKVERVKIKNPK